MLKAFDSVTVYSIRGFQCLSGEEISSLLAQSVFSPCRDTDLSRSGWATSDDGITPVSVISGNDAVFYYRIDSKRISRSLINQRVKKEAKEWMRRTGYRKVKALERKRMRAEITAEEIKVAYLKTIIIPVWFDLDNHRLCVGTKSKEMAETIVSAIRSCCRSIPAVPLVSDADGESMINNISTSIVLIGGRYCRDSDNAIFTISAVDNVSNMSKRLIADGFSPDFVEIDTGPLVAKVTKSLSLRSIRFNFRAVKTPACITRQVAAIKNTINTILR